MTLNTRITTALEPPETQLRFYDYITLALEDVVIPTKLAARADQTPRKSPAARERRRLRRGSKRTRRARK